MSLIAACFVVMFRFAEPVLEKSKKDVQPTYVVLSPYAYRNNKTVKFIEKTAFGVGKLALPQCACKSLVAIVCVSPSSGRCPSCASTTVVPRPDPFPIFSSPRLVRIYLPRSNPSCVPAPVPSPVRLATTAAAATTSTKRVDPEADRRSAAMNEVFHASSAELYIYYRRFSRRDDRYADRGDRYDDRRGGGGRYERRGGRPQDGRENPRPSNCLGIFGMSMNTNESDLRKIFERYGRVESVKIIMDHRTRRSRGFGFIYFEEKGDATKARERVADTIIDGMKTLATVSMKIPELWVDDLPNTRI
uniref:RRM domain-containing protein n=1 Tax=Panagrellus redivivus TaxID=6233 RepID=A0A7E4UPJ6_PANRE